MRTLKDWLLGKYLVRITESLFNTISEKDILRQVGGRATFRGKEVTEETLKGLKRDADWFSNSLLQEVLLDECRYVASKVIYGQSKVDNDMLFGKTLLYLTDEIIRKKIESLKNT